MDDSLEQRSEVKYNTAALELMSCTWTLEFTPPSFLIVINLTILDYNY